MPYAIRVRTGLEEGELYPLIENREIILGRSPTNNIFIRDKNVSREHCQIVVTSEGCKLTDLQSTNGTFVNGIRETESVLQKNDEIRMGTTLLVLEEVDTHGHPVTDTAELKVCPVQPEGHAGQSHLIPRTKRRIRFEAKLEARNPKS